MLVHKRTPTIPIGRNSIISMLVINEQLEAQQNNFFLEDNKIIQPTEIRKQQKHYLDFQIRGTHSST